MHYKFHGGSPPHRGNHIHNASLQLPRPATVGELLSQLRKLVDVSHDGVGFFAVPAGSPMPSQEKYRTAEVTRGKDLKSLDSHMPLSAAIDKTTDTIVAFEGFTPGFVDIGVYAAAHEPAPNAHDPAMQACDAPGAAWLCQPEPPTVPPPAADIAAVASAVCAMKIRSPAAGSRVGLTRGDDTHASPVVAPAALAALVRLVDAAWTAQRTGAAAPLEGPATNALAAGVLAGSGPDDFRMLLLPSHARELLGADAYAAVCAALDDCERPPPPPPPAYAGEGAAVGLPPPPPPPPDALVLRRTQATGRWIGFHTDNAARTVQVPLTGCGGAEDDGGAVGGHLLFVSADGTLVAPGRTPGALLVHDGDAVHGVTALVAGVRRSFYALRARGALAG